MKHVFNYNKYSDADFNTLIESGYALTQAYLEGKGNTAEYETANREFTEKYMKTCVEAVPNMKFTSLEDVKNPMINDSTFFIEKFNTILAQILTPVVPTVISNGYEQLYDVTQVGWGKCRPAS